MISVLIIAIVCTMGAVFISASVNARHFKKYGVASSTKITASVICIILTLILSVSLPFLISPAPTRNSEKILVVNHKSIYYDSQKDEYFTLETNPWDVMHIYERDILDYQSTKKLADAYQNYQSAIKEYQTGLR